MPHEEKLSGHIGGYAVVDAPSDTARAGVVYLIHYGRALVERYPGLYPEGHSIRAALDYLNSLTPGGPS